MASRKSVVPYYQHPAHVANSGWLSDQDQTLAWDQHTHLLKRVTKTNESQHIYDQLWLTAKHLAHFRDHP